MKESNRERLGTLILLISRSGICDFSKWRVGCATSGRAAVIEQLYKRTDLISGPKSLGSSNFLRDDLYKEPIKTANFIWASFDMDSSPEDAMETVEILTSLGMQLARPGFMNGKCVYIYAMRNENLPSTDNTKQVEEHGPGDIIL